MSRVMQMQIWFENSVLYLYVLYTIYLVALTRLRERQSPVACIMMSRGILAERQRELS